MKILDLFCGCGGMSMGYALASNARITGVDIEYQKDYPFCFIQDDFRELPDSFLREFDFISASPPCQAFSTMTPDRSKHPNFILETRAILQRAGKPHCIENVPGAPIRHDLLLCGEMFGLKVIRHRFFELSFPISQPIHRRHKGFAERSTQNKKNQCYGENYYYASVCGYLPGLRNKINYREWKEAMEITWTDDYKAISEAIPPKYSEYIMRSFLGKNTNVLEQMRMF